MSSSKREKLGRNPFQAKHATFELGQNFSEPTSPENDLPFFTTETFEETIEVSESGPFEEPLTFSNTAPFEESAEEKPQDQSLTPLLDWFTIELPSELFILGLKTFAIVKESVSEIKKNKF